MGKSKSPEKESDREKKWNKVFNALVKLPQNLQKDREFLEQRVRSLQEVIFRLKMEQKFETMKAELNLGLKEREGLIYKHRYDKADEELSELWEWLDLVSQKYLETESTSDGVGKRVKDSQNKALRDEVRKLKSDIERYKVENNSEMSALLAEKNFVWNQYNKLESDLTEKLRKKCDEAKRASENMQLLVNRAEELQCSNEKLRTDLAKVESESAQKSEEISRLVKEIEFLKSRCGSESTPLPPCNDKTALSCRGGKDAAANGGRVKKESDPINIVEKAAHTKQTARKSIGGKAHEKPLAIKGSVSFKRNPIKVITNPDTPKLFSSSFKVPKLKHSISPRVI